MCPLFLWFQALLVNGGPNIFPDDVSKMCLNVWTLFWHILDKFWTLCRRLKKCLKSSKSVLKVSKQWHWFGYILDIKGTFGHHLDVTWTPFGHYLDTLYVWTHFGHFLDTFWTYFGHFHIFCVQNLSIHTSLSSTKSRGVSQTEHVFLAFCHIFCCYSHVPWSSSMKLAPMIALIDCSKLATSR